MRYTRSLQVGAYLLRLQGVPHAVLAGWRITIPLAAQTKADMLLVDRRLPEQTGVASRVPEWRKLAAVADHEEIRKHSLSPYELLVRGRFK